MVITVGFLSNFLKFDFARFRFRFIVFRQLKPKWATQADLAANETLLFEKVKITKINVNRSI